jgi:hypothetical protein
MSHLGKLPARYSFFLNPYPDLRFTSCPQCGAKMRQRKLPLVIHVEPHYFLALNKTCKYCPSCDLLLAHKDILEDLLARMFAERAPQIIGNDYLVVGTMDRSDWHEGVHAGVSLAEMLRSLHDFKRVLSFKPAPAWGPQQSTRQRT